MGAPKVLRFGNVELATTKLNTETRRHEDIDPVLRVHLIRDTGTSLVVELDAEEALDLVAGVADRLVHRRRVLADRRRRLRKLSEEVRG